MLPSSANIVERNLKDGIIAEESQEQKPLLSSDSFQVVAVVIADKSSYIKYALHEQDWRNDYSFCPLISLHTKNVVDSILISFPLWVVC